MTITLPTSDGGTTEHEVVRIDKPEWDIQTRYYRVTFMVEQSKIMSVTQLDLACPGWRGKVKNYNDK